MAVQGGEDVYATLLLNDLYLPGALVLAHSLRDAGTSKQLAVLVTLDSVSADVITQLKTVYDHIIPVPRIRNESPANLYLMNRSDLHSAFTKINLWKQTQFRKIVYIDADVVAYRAPDELFNIPDAFSAAPDIGWPDLFNTGVMVLAPNMGDYYAMMAMAERGISFDGADQGLLNMYFKTGYNRLSFTYNVTPSAHYQYVPAYRHFQSSINMVHFIGAEKPWAQGRDASKGSGPFDEMSGRWWAVYDRHYREGASTPTPQQPAPGLVQYFVKGEFRPRPVVEPTGEPHRSVTGFSGFSATPGSRLQGQCHHHSPTSHPLLPPLPPAAQLGYNRPHQEGSGDQAHQQAHQQAHHHHHHHHHPHQQHQDLHGTGHEHYHAVQHLYSDPTSSGHDVPQAEHSVPPPSESFATLEGTQAEARPEQVQEPHRGPPSPPPTQEHKEEPFQPTMHDWDAQRQPPPQDSKPEALNFPQAVYEMSQDTAPFVAPERYPSPPRNMWYEVPREPPAPATQRPKPIFPWEANQPKPSRVFTGAPWQEEAAMTAQPPAGASGEPTASHDSPAPAEPSVAESSSVEQRSEPETPTTPTIQITPSDPWSAFTRTNAWDEVPEIERYVGAMQKNRRTKSQGRPGAPGKIDLGDLMGVRGDQWRRGSKVTDFPTEAERPSLPVTPAPVRRPRFWGGGAPGAGDEDEDPLLPTAEGVPAQSEWDPVAQLQKLAKQQSELLHRLGHGEGGGADVATQELPNRPLPFGSEESKSPTYVAQSPSIVVSPQPLKPVSSASSVRNMLDEQDTTPRTSYGTEAAETTGEAILKPSYTGPGASFEKGDDYPTHHTPAQPSEEEMDILET